MKNTKLTFEERKKKWFDESVRKREKEKELRKQKAKNASVFYYSGMKTTINYNENTNENK